MLQGSFIFDKSLQSNEYHFNPLAWEYITEFYVLGLLQTKAEFAQTSDVQIRIQPLSSESESKYKTP